MNTESDRTGPALKILHLIIRVGAPSSQYNEHCLPVAHERDITICTYFTNLIVPPPVIRVFEGDGTLRGFWQELGDALRLRHDVIHAHAPQTGLIVALKLMTRRRLMRSAVYTVHNSYRNFRLRNRPPLYPIFAFFPHIVVCSSAVLDSLPRFLRWLGRGKISIIQNGVDTERVDRIVTLNKAPIGNGEFRVVSVARLIDRKNPFTLLAAFNEYQGPQDRLVFVGDGDLGPELRERVDALGIPQHVTFEGMLARDDVYRRLVEGDIYVSTSRGEGLPVSVLEAMACAVPVILSDIPPHREIVGEADFVPLVAPNDVSGFRREIERFKEMTPEERTDIGKRCRRLVDDRFSLRAMHKNYERIYAEAISVASEEVR
jgi:glycosyltransferase involved in cell wall biosynthesis